MASIAKSIPRSRMIIIGVVVAILLAFVLIFLGLIPGLSVTKKTLPKISLAIWGVDPPAAYAPFIAAFKKQYGNITITYRQFDEQSYEQNLIDALAAGAGPDIFAIKNTWIPKHYNKIAPLTETQFPFANFQTMYPTVVRQDFSSDNIIYALPLYVDTMSLLYNSNLLDRAAIVTPPTTWTEFQKTILPLVQKQPGGTFSQAAAAIGGSRQTIPFASDLLSLLLLQYGAGATDAAGRTEIQFSSPEAQQAFSFYTQFANPKSPLYTWNDSQNQSVDSFAAGQTAMIFDYYETAKAVRAKNPFIPMQLAPMLQLATQEPIAYARYYGLTVSNRSKNADWAWFAVLSLLTDPANARMYAQTTDRLPALRTLIGEYLTNPQYETLARQALVAQSWYQPDSDRVDDSLSGAISRTISGTQTISDALHQMGGEIASMMQK